MLGARDVPGDDEGEDRKGRRALRCSAMTRSEAILRFLEQHRGEMFCADCLADALFPTKFVYSAIVQLEGAGTHRSEGRCSACGKRRLVSGVR
jgi:hypothetical protein